MTLVVNVSGAAVLGVITGLALGHTEALLAGTATIGAYTHVLDLDVRDPVSGRGPPGPRHGGEHCGQSSRRSGRGSGRALAGGFVVNVDCLKLTAYFGERGRAEGRFLPT